jgi:hypothetical protein
MDKLTPEQARTIGAVLGPTQGYLFRLVQRMD